MGSLEETKEAHAAEESTGPGFCHDPYKVPLPEYCDICTHALQVRSGCYYCLLNDKYI